MQVHMVLCSPIFWQWKCIQMALHIALQIFPIVGQSFGSFLMMYTLVVVDQSLKSHIVVSGIILILHMTTTNHLKDE
jgi:hypothetical protein